MDFTIWTLNRCTELLANQDQAIRDICANIEAGVTFGERMGTNESPRQLMPTREYFVPIPLKCIGGKYLDPGPHADTRLLKAITDSYEFFKADQFHTWWTTAAQQHGTYLPDPFRPQMLTEFGTGYYELLEAHDNNILIGYSQGGLVARYLAFLDRHVFKRNKILAVFTVSSPNYGSPLANPANSKSITAGLFEFIATLFSLHADRFGGLYSEIGQRVDFPAMYAVLAAAALDAANPPHELQALLETAVKWLSGLHGDSNTAFAEVGANNFSKPQSVLSLVNDDRQFPTEVFTGSVISANSEFDDLLRSLLFGGRPATFGKRLMERVEEEAFDIFRSLRVFGLPIRTNESAAGQLYQTQVITEASGQNAIPLLTKLQQDFASGVNVEAVFGPEKRIPEFAHDYVIPSVRQLLPRNPTLLGQFVNRKASHNSGKSPEFEAGADNVKALHELLARLCAAVTAQGKAAGQA